MYRLLPARKPMVHVVGRIKHLLTPPARFDAENDARGSRSWPEIIDANRADASLDRERTSSDIN
jgi:hypothetical protein